MRNEAELLDQDDSDVQQAEQADNHQVDFILHFRYQSASSRVLNETRYVYADNIIAQMYSDLEIGHLNLRYR